MGPDTLAARVALVTVAVAVVAVLVTGLVSVGLVRQAAQVQARAALARQANVARQIIDADRPRSVGRAVRALRDEGQNIRVARVLPNGTVRGDPLARRAVAARPYPGTGTDASYRVRVDGRVVYVEVRALSTGGSLVLAQPEANAARLVASVVRRTLFAAAVGLAVAVLAGLLLAWRLAAPLKRASAAAQLLGSGRRDVRVPPGGPAEVAEVADSLNALGDALASSEERQREFLLSVSHELRTPLTAIKGFAEALADGVTTDDAAARRAGGTIRAEADRLGRLVADLLDLARLGADDFRIEPAPVDLVELLRHAADVWSARCEAVGVRFAAELHDRSLPVVTDAARMRQVVDGLAENALRVTPAGRPIVFAARAEAGWALVEVRDGGPGLTEADLAVAFDRSVLYERYRGVRRVGTGVGLALVHGLVTRLGGTPSAGHAPEGGARFSVRIPLA
ncbi:MAG: HAMP domain-containing histidine kinase [Acidothermales bacterium]|nr:HAMP domain-containing histidine kinase [Acidothermales bacterium]